MILLVDNYDSFTFNIYQDLEKCGYSIQVVRNDQLEIEEVLAMNPEAVIFSPGPGRPEKAGICLELMKKLPESTPVLGICLGHQIIGESFGYKTVKAPKVVHGRVETINFSHPDFPSSIKATRYHSLVIQKEDENSPLEELAHTDDGVLMAVRHKNRPILGLQFHPESFGTTGGLELMEQFFQQNLQYKERRNIS